MAANISSICLPGDEFSKIAKLHVREGSKVNIGRLLVTYEPEDTKTQTKLKSEIVGTVSQTLAKEGHVMPPGSILLQIRGCEHPIVMKDMCAECGADLRENVGRPGMRKESVSASVAMVHSVPELIISEQDAIELGKADEQRLLSCRKLVLLVDLDQTLLHTTNDNIPPNLKDVYHFQLLHNNSWMWYHTKFRPGTEKFLENISKLFEMHICTFGVRMYAHTIARFLDPHGKHFSHRILSRDECFNATSKTANLKALFPCGDSMVVIIDDREDVWNYAKNLVHVKPYHFFVGTADINAPPGMGKDEDDANTKEPHEAVKKSPEKDQTSQPSDEKKEIEKIDPLGEASENKLDTEMETETTCPTKDEDGAEDAEKSKTENVDEDKSKENEQVAYSNKKDEDDLIEWEDSDDYLTYLEEILTRIHKAFYDMYDEMQGKSKSSEEVPDFKNIVPYVKRKTLKGCNIVFSGVFPLNVPPEKSKEYHIARSLGANVQTAFVPKVGDNPNATTHLVAARLGTEKVKLALKSDGVHVVMPDWLSSCNSRWERVDERLFLLTKDCQMSGAREKSPDVSQLRKDDKPSKRKLDQSENTPVYDSKTGKKIDSSKRTKIDLASINNKPHSQVKDDATQTGSSGKSEPGCSSAGVFEDIERKTDVQPPGMFSRSFNPLYSFSSDELEDMDKEVEEILESEESDDDEKADKELRRRVLDGDNGSDSSSGESLSGEYPRGWKRKHEKGRKSLDANDENKDDTAENGDESEKSFKINSDNSDSEYAESVGSVDEEMAAEVEKLISRQTPL